MKLPRALKNFSKLSGSQLESKARVVNACMKNNPYFKSPNPPLKTLEVAIEKYSSALVLSQSRDMMKVLDKKIQRKALEDVLSLLVQYVNYTANGDRVQLLSSGFDVSTPQQQQAANSDSTLINLKVMQGEKSGEIIIICDSVPLCRCYLFSYGQTPIVDDNWKSEQGRVCKMTIKGLERGKEYAVRVNALGPKKKSYHTVVVTIIVN
ncbi:MAG: hypothetical protein QM726_09505 [Chitinophagaceae bacterium]